MERTNEMWLKHLRDGSPQQAEAIEDLRQYLKRAVLIYLHTRSDLSHLAASELQQMSEDFIQDALLKIQASLDTFRGKSKFTTWAAKVAANHTISELRRAKWRDLSLDAITDAGTSLQEVLAFDSVPGSNPDTESERRQVWQVIADVINSKLTERQRQVLVAVRVDNVPMAEVAELLDTNINNIYKLLHDARLKLKQGLQKLGWEPQYILQLFGEDG
jgi:RNA polymerase sigma-70 factor (ECF subfamily)